MPSAFNPLVRLPRIIAVLYAAAAAAVGTAFADPAGDAATRPNIVFILADDLGWRDLGITGSPVCETPRLDALARQGVRFSQAYAPAPICSASRAAILTGRSPARLGLEFVVKESPGRQNLPGTKLETPPFTLALPPDETTIAERLAETGYATAFFGKWHLNPHHGRYLGWHPELGPKSQGFAVAEEDFGGHPYAWQGKPKGELPSIDLPKGTFPADSLTDRAIDYLSSRDGDQPFFLMVSHFYVHTPVKTQAEWLTRRYAERLGVEPSSPRARYAAFVRILDHHVGRLLDAIDAHPQRDNMLVVFTSDNGGDPRFTRHGPLRGHKWTLYEGGLRVPLLVRWPSRLDGGRVADQPVIGTDLFPTFVEAAGETPREDDQIDGRSLLPLLSGETPADPLPRTFVWHFPYYHPESNLPSPPVPQTAGVDDDRVPFLEPHSAVRIGREKTLLFHETGRVERFTVDAEGAIDEIGGVLTGEAAEVARSVVLNELSKRNARLPTLK